MGALAFIRVLRRTVPPMGRAAVCAAIVALAASRCPAAPETAADTVRADTTRADTARTILAPPAAARPDTARARERVGVWGMDRLKGILGSETSGLEAGKYRERKSGRVAMACAFVLPGLGQIYNEKPIKAAIVLSVNAFYLGEIYLQRRYWAEEKIERDKYPIGSFAYDSHNRMVKERWDRSVDWIWWSGAVVLISVIDAYVDAHLDDMRFKVAPTATPSGGGAGMALFVSY